MSQAYADVPVLGVGETITLCNSLLAELTLQVEGEVANYSVSRGKFVFFDLKDLSGESRLGCFMILYQQNVPLEDGMHIVVHAQAGLYAKSGQFRLTVRNIQIQGEGNLKRAFELLKAKLEAEGLFLPERKRLLPLYPQRIGVISSADAAGYGDFMRIAEQRLPGLHFILVNVAVQGIHAEQEISAAFDYLNSYGNPDVIVLIRGGGSMEDLHAFNSEKVARAIVRSKVPVVVGVGHERDITIADFSADVRAATPSNAAQIVIPERDALQRKVDQVLLSQRHFIAQQIAEYRYSATTVLTAIRTLVHQHIDQAKYRTHTVISAIDALAPIRVLERGYSITRTATGKVVTKATQVRCNDLISTQFAEGIHTSRII
jgi:exodeoxyribonuclease VII large subunit